MWCMIASSLLVILSFCYCLSSYCMMMLNYIRHYFAKKKGLLREHCPAFTIVF